MKAYVEAHGCALSFGESREMEDLLLGGGWDLVDKPECADLSVLVTCVVVERTERRMLRRVKALSVSQNLVVAGCMPSVGREKIMRTAPRAMLTGPGGAESLSKVLPYLNGTPLARHREGYAIVPIATGCSWRCSYCLTRLSRGPLRSRAEASIVAAVERMAAERVMEIQLTSQDSASYGTDDGTTLPRLVERICAVPRDFRLRIGMMNPRSVMPILGDVARMYDLAKVFKFLHLPIQSGSDAILDRMVRGYTVEDCVKIVDKVRRVAPSLSLSTDLIVGFPGEDESDHESNLKIISELRPDIVNVTKYSARPGTEASRSKAVVGRIAKDRSREITDLRFRIALERNQEWVGRNVRALATELGKKGSTIFRTDEYRQIVVQEKRALGEFSRIEISRATPTYLIGRRASAA